MIVNRKKANEYWAKFLIKAGARVLDIRDSRYKDWDRMNIGYSTYKNGRLRLKREKVYTEIGDYRALIYYDQYVKFDYDLLTLEPIVTKDHINSLAVRKGVVYGLRATSIPHLIGSYEDISYCKEIHEGGDLLNKSERLSSISDNNLILNRYKRPIITNRGIVIVKSETRSYPIERTKDMTSTIRYQYKSGDREDPEPRKRKGKDVSYYEVVTEKELAKSTTITTKELGRRIGKLIRERETTIKQLDFGVEEVVIPVITGLNPFSQHQIS